MPFKTCFNYAYIKIKLALNIKLLAHYAKGTLSLLKAPTDCLHQILGSFNSKEVLFHLSLTVLCSLSVIQNI